MLLEATLRNNLGQVVHTYVPLSPSSITWYRPKGSDALRLGRQLQAWRKVMAAYRRVDDLWSPAGWLPVHRDQLRAQCPLSSMRSLYLYLFMHVSWSYCTHNYDLHALKKNHLHAEHMHKKVAIAGHRYNVNVKTSKEVSETSDRPE